MDRPTLEIIKTATKESHYIAEEPDTHEMRESYRAIEQKKKRGPKFKYSTLYVVVHATICQLGLQHSEHRQIHTKSCQDYTVTVIRKKNFKTNFQIKQKSWDWEHCAAVNGESFE